MSNRNELSIQETNDKMNEFMEYKKPIYLNGPSGSGKTTFLKKYFNNKDVNMKYISLKNINHIDYLDEITNINIIDSFYKNKKMIIIVIDDIDILNIQEKTIINEMIKKIKLINKTKEKISYNLIFSGINFTDKKIKELMSLSNVLYLGHYQCNKNIYLNIENIINKKHDNINLFDYDKTIQSLLLHENIINNLNKDNITFYYHFLNNFCNGDYYDRISFQKQIWLYNDITFYIKFFVNIILYNNEKVNIKKNEIRFTKILTKYSNEYNNNVYLNTICGRLFITYKQLYNLCLKNEEIKDISIKERQRLHKIFYGH